MKNVTVLALALLLSCLATAQTIHTPTLEGDQTFTGKNSLNLMCSMNGIKFSSCFASGSNTCGIQEAANALPSTGGMVSIDQGCTVTASIEPGKTVRFLCAGTNPTAGVAAISLTQGASLANPVFDFTNTNDVGSSVDGCSISGLGGGGGDLVRIQTNSIKLSNLIVRSAGRDGIRIGEDSGSHNANNFVLENVIANGNTRHGIYVHSASLNANSGTITHLLTETNGGDGVRFDSAAHNTILNLDSEANTGYGLNILNSLSNNSGYHLILGADVNEANTAGNLNVAAGSFANIYIGPNHSSSPNVLPSMGIQGTAMTGQGALFGYGVVAGNTAAPSCDSTQRGKLWYVPGAGGVNDLVEVCAKDAANSYAWRPWYGGNVSLTGTLDVAGLSTLTGLKVSASVTQGSGLKHQRITTGSIPLSSSLAVTLTWTSAFADANYTPTCSVEEGSTSLSTLRVHHIESVSNAAIVVRIANDDAGGAHTGLLTCIAMHD